MPYTAAKRLRWGDGYIEIGEAVPDNEPGRRYDLMVRYGEIHGAPAIPVAETAVALVLEQKQTHQDVQGSTASLPAINIETATKRDLMAWIAAVTGREPGPASKEDTLRARVAELLTERTTSAEEQGDQPEAPHSGGQPSQPDQTPPPRLSEGPSTGTMTTSTDPALRAP